jgi:chromosome segregation ATPase
MFTTVAEAPPLPPDPLLDTGLVDHLLERERALQTEITRLRSEAEAMEAELLRALDLSRARRERDGLTRRVASLEAELGATLRQHFQAAARIAEMDGELQARDCEHRRLAGQIEELDRALQERDRRIRRMRATLSWRLGAPLRALGGWRA